MIASTASVLPFIAFARSAMSAVGGTAAAMAFDTSTSIVSFGCTVPMIIGFCPRTNAEIIVGPLFAQSVTAVGQVARSRGIPVIAFSTDSSVAAPGVHLLSFLPETDVKRIVDYAVSRGKRSFAALLPDNAYGTVVEAAFRQEVPRRGGRIVALEKYPVDPGRTAEAIKRVAQSASHADALFVPDDGTMVPNILQQLAADGVNLKRIQLLGTGLWADNPQLAGDIQSGVKRRLVIAEQRGAINSVVTGEVDRPDERHHRHLLAKYQGGVRAAFVHVAQGDLGRARGVAQHDIEEAHGFVGGGPRLGAQAAQRLPVDDHAAQQQRQKRHGKGEDQAGHQPAPGITA